MNKKIIISTSDTQDGCKHWDRKRKPNLSLGKRLLSPLPSGSKSSRQLFHCQHYRSEDKQGRRKSEGGTPVRPVMLVVFVRFRVVAVVVIVVVVIVVAVVVAVVDVHEVVRKDDVAEIDGELFAPGG